MKKKKITMLKKKLTGNPKAKKIPEVKSVKIKKKIAYELHPS
jgi:hypothetical protein